MKSLLREVCGRPPVGAWNAILNRHQGAYRVVWSSLAGRFLYLPKGQIRLGLMEDIRIVQVKL